MRVPPLGSKEVVATQSVEYTPMVEDVNKEEEEYEPLPENEGGNYDPYVDDMVDDDYGEDFIINCGIVFVFPYELDEVSKCQK